MQAEKKMLDEGGNKEYLPIDGLASFNKATIDLLLGFDHPAVKEVSIEFPLEPHLQIDFVGRCPTVLICAVV